MNIDAGGTARVKGQLNVKGNAILGDGNTKNTWILHTPDDDRKSLMVAFLNRDTGDWD